MSRKVASLLASFLFASFVYGGESWAQSINIFGDLVPGANTQANNTPLTLGVKFWSTQSGTLSGIRFYRGTTSPHGYVARLYSAAGGLLGSVTLAHELSPVPGWQEATFAAPISISPNTTYVAALYLPSGTTYQRVPYELAQGVTSGPLTAPANSAVGGNGVYSSGSAFPRSAWESANFFVDVLFTPSAATLLLNFSPPNPSIPANTPLGSVVATINATWSDGSPFTGTLSFAQPYSNDQGTFAISGNNLIINPSGPGLSGDGNTVQNVTIVATQ
jgi:hypothetical protein